MPDDEPDRDENAENLPPERKRENGRDRGEEDEAMAGDTDRRLGELDSALTAHEYPTTTNDLVEAYGDYEIETQNGTNSLEDVLASTEDQTFVSADDVRSRILGLIHR